MILPIILLSILAPLVTAQDCKIDLLFLFDSSGSVRYAFDTQLQFLEQIGGLLQIAPDKHRVAVVVYSGYGLRTRTYSWEDFPDTETFLTKLKTIPYLSGTTQTGKGMRAAFEVLKRSRPDAKRILVSLTDGWWDDDPDVVLEQIKESIPDILTFAIAVYKTVRIEGLTILAGDSSRIFIGHDAVDQARSKFDELLPGCFSEQPIPTPRATTIDDLPPGEEVTLASTDVAETTIDDLPPGEEVTLPSTDAAETTIDDLPPEKEGTTESPDIGDIDIIDVVAPEIEITTQMTTTPEMEVTTAPPTDSGELNIIDVVTPPTPTTPKPTTTTTGSMPSVGPPPDGSICDRKPYREACDDGSRPQFTLRWYVRQGECTTYPWGYCHGTTVTSEPAIRTKKKCKCKCLGKC